MDAPPPASWVDVKEFLREANLVGIVQTPHSNTRAWCDACSRKLRSGNRASHKWVEELWYKHAMQGRDLPSYREVGKGERREIFFKIALPLLNDDIDGALTILNEYRKRHSLVPLKTSDAIEEVPPIARRRQRGGSILTVEGSHIPSAETLPVSNNSNSGGHNTEMALGEGTVRIPGFGLDPASPLSELSDLGGRDGPVDSPLSGSDETDPDVHRSKSKKRGRSVGKRKKASLPTRETFMAHRPKRKAVEKGSQLTSRQYKLGSDPEEDSDLEDVAPTPAKVVGKKIEPKSRKKSRSNIQPHPKPGRPRKNAAAEDATSSSQQQLVTCDTETEVTENQTSITVSPSSSKKSAKSTPAKKRGRQGESITEEARLSQSPTMTRRLRSNSMAFLPSSLSRTRTSSTKEKTQRSKAHLKGSGKKRALSTKPSAKKKKGLTLPEECINEVADDHTEPPLKRRRLGLEDSSTIHVQEEAKASHIEGSLASPDAMSVDVNVPALSYTLPPVTSSSSDVMMGPANSVGPGTRDGYRDQQQPPLHPKPLPAILVFSPKTSADLHMKSTIVRTDRSYGGIERDQQPSPSKRLPAIEVPRKRGRNASFKEQQQHPLQEQLLHAAPQDEADRNSRASSPEVPLHRVQTLNTPSNDNLRRSPSHTTTMETIIVQPPCKIPIDPPVPPSAARAPNKHDTHHWKYTPDANANASKLPPPQPTPKIFLDFLKLPVQSIEQEKKPFPVRPLVWAQSRQELCESLPFFKAYQGGVYSHNKWARGYLLDGHGAKHDLWHDNGKVIISHGGGHSATDRETGETVLVENQSSESPSCKALLRTWESKMPIALIAGDGYNLLPYAMPPGCSYVVLGFYVIAHAWEEPEQSSASSEGYFVRWKFLFQWIEAQGIPWWIPKSEIPDPRTQVPSPIPPIHAYRKCEACDKLSANIYTSGWMCTNSGCKLFYRQSIPAFYPPPKDIGYEPAFLAIQSLPNYIKASDLNICPPPYVQQKITDGQEASQDGTSRPFWRGFWCDRCGRLTCREYWTRWVCGSCHKEHSVKTFIHGTPGINKADGKVIDSLSPEVIMPEPSILLDGNEQIKYQKFVLPGDKGIIHFLRVDHMKVRMADQIWYQYQIDAQQHDFFRRYGMRTHKLKGRMLSHYFSQNSGERYAYVGGTENTVPLDTYDSVKSAMQYIRRRATLALGQDPGFNEILSVAYMAEQKMEFHSDGERDLGPIVAGLSLGASAIMAFRPVPSRWKAAEPEADRKSPPIFLKLLLRHGDMVVMEGAELQEFYQHAVYPNGFRIAATARFIKTEKAV